MELTAEQRAILEGGRGPYLAQCMRWLVEWGEALGARRLVRCDNTHVLLCVPNLVARGASPRTLEAFAEGLREACRHAVAPGCVATVHTLFLTLDPLDVPENDPEQVRVQREIAAMAVRAGYLTTFTCAPYLVGNVPIKGEICAWTESSAVVYANSILGARTVRHGNESAIAASLLGLVPEFGVLLDENRRGTLRVEVRAELRHPTDWGALGYFTGKIAGLGVPVFEGLRRPSQDEAKQLCAALATSGGVSMFHIAGVTPEAPSLEAAFGGRVPEQKIVFTEADLRATYDSLRNATGDEIEAVILGCPHASLREIWRVAHWLEGKRVAPGVRLWINAARVSRSAAQDMGLLGIIESAGGLILCDTCPTNMRIACRRLVTDGFKQAHYARSMIGAEVIVASTEACLRAAVAGRWMGDD
ncbi:MAG: aconitase X catalytic domain-containing protein [Bryobacterales bacterium]|nr:aconitase X catalytic domain-containing protein [Bryobacteraceae bacterium]MDW8129727.1 aconitase X catalytic domain-containing protein [Bryobacterales bacterium]